MQEIKIVDALSELSQSVGLTASELLDACKNVGDNIAPPRIWLIGESNPYGADPYYALYPQPSNATGGRLARALGLTDDEYLDSFERRNLLTGNKWSVPRARAAADGLLSSHPQQDKFVLLGAKVASAFYVSFRENLCEPKFIPVGTLKPCMRLTLVLPHPSGLSRVWNERGMRQRVREAVAKLHAMDGGS